MDSKVDEPIFLNLDPNGKSNQQWIRRNSGLTSLKTVKYITTINSNIEKSNQGNDFNGFSLTNIDLFSVTHYATDDSQLPLKAKVTLFWQNGPFRRSAELAF